MTESRTFDAYTNFLAIARTVLVPPIAVYDGPQPGLPSDQQMLLVGCADAVPNGTELTVDSGTQQWLDLGAATVKETFRLWNTFICWNASNDLAACRLQAKTALDALELAVRPGPFGTGDGQLNGALAPTGWCNLAITRWQHKLGSVAWSLHVQFAIDCWAQI